MLIVLQAIQRSIIRDSPAFSIVTQEKMKGTAEKLHDHCSSKSKNTSSLAEYQISYKVEKSQVYTGISDLPAWGRCTSVAVNFSSVL